MATVAENFAELKQRLRATWMAGDFGQIAKLNAREGEGFIQRLNLKPGTKVLDVACGTGNQSIPSARAGAEVIGLDIAHQSPGAGPQTRRGRKTENRIRRRRRRKDSLRSRPLRCCALHVRRHVRPAARCGRLRTNARLPPRRLDRHGQLDSGRLCRPDVPDHLTPRPASARHAASVALGR